MNMVIVRTPPPVEAGLAPINMSTDNKNLVDSVNSEIFIGENPADREEKLK